MNNLLATFCLHFYRRTYQLLLSACIVSRSQVYLPLSLWLYFVRRYSLAQSWPPLAAADTTSSDISSSDISNTAKAFISLWRKMESTLRYTAVT